jgi:hypothetical protein
MRTTDVLKIISSNLEPKLAAEIINAAGFIVTLCPAGCSYNGYCCYKHDDWVQDEPNEAVFSLFCEKGREFCFSRKRVTGDDIRNIRKYCL